MEFLLFNEFLKNLIFFQLPIKKVGFITLIMSKFQILNTNLWSIYSKRSEFMVHTFICAFWEIKIFQLLRPSKYSETLKRPYFWILEIWVCFTKLGLGANFLKILDIRFTLIFDNSCVTSRPLKMLSFLTSSKAWIKESSSIAPAWPPKK